MTNTPMRRNKIKWWQNEGIHVAIGASKKTNVSLQKTQFLIPYWSLQLCSALMFLVQPLPLPTKVEDAMG